MASRKRGRQWLAWRVKLRGKSGVKLTSPVKLTCGARRSHMRATAGVSCGICFVQLGGSGGGGGGGLFGKAPPTPPPARNWVAVA
eukprot:scaffold3972_cov76-Phaeocystis_antarctica.AAC.2